MMQQQPILDRDHLSRYTLGDGALEREVLDLFIGQIPESLANLRGSDDPKQWLRAAHTIKGSARAVGAWRLAEIAEQAECGAEQAEKWSALAAAIESAVCEVRDEIQAVRAN